MKAKKSQKTTIRCRNIQSVDDLRYALEEHNFVCEMVGVMPARPHLKHCQHVSPSLRSAILKRHGGSKNVAQLLGLTVSSDLHRAESYRDPDKMKTAVFDVIARYGTQGKMPTHELIRKAGYIGLRTAMRNYHGGFYAVAELLGLEPAIPPRHFTPEYCSDPENIVKDLLAFMKSHGISGRVPISIELRNAGASGLNRAIRKYVGFENIAERLGLPHISEAAINAGREPRSFWKNPRNVEAALKEVNHLLGTVGIIPTLSRLRELGFRRLAESINQNFGGRASVAERFDYKTVKAVKSRKWGFWKDPDNLRTARELVSEAFGTVGVLPTEKQMKDAGQTVFPNIIRKLGGRQKVAQMLGLKLVHNAKPSGFWKNPNAVRTELEKYNLENNTSGIMPTFTQLKQAGRSDLAQAVSKLGGRHTVAQMFGFAIGDGLKKPSAYWSNPENFKRELFAHNIGCKMEGTVPSQTHLQQCGRTYLDGVIWKYGGAKAVARMFGLLTATEAKCENKRIIFNDKMEKLQKLADSLLPLAEAGQLSPEQIMLILHHGGLLEESDYRISHMRSLLLSKSLRSTEGCYWAIGNDEQRNSFSAQNEKEKRELCAMNGLEALASVGLPLDDSLKIVTLKLLWEAFFERLQNWYASLPIAPQQIGEDVINEAIGFRYADHQANPFMYSAWQIFTEQVHSAVGFSRNSLCANNWSGPTLKLHQASAAERMSQMLKGENAYVLLADDPGTGKTITTLASIAGSSNVRTVVVIAPSIVADETWLPEIKRCIPRSLVIRGMNHVQQAESSRIRFYVLHYEQLLNREKLAAFLHDQEFDCLVIDETHCVKRRSGWKDSRRRHAVATLRDHAKAVIGMTGTPLKNELEEPLSLLRIISGDKSYSSHRFLNHKLSDVAQVYEKMLPHIIRRSKKLVLPGLIPPSIQVISIPLKADVVSAISNTLKASRGQTGTAIAQLRKISVENKLPTILQLVCEASGKVLILTYLREHVSKRLYAYLQEHLPAGTVGHICGETFMPIRRDILQSFRQPEGDVKVLVATMGTTGAGLTLFEQDAHCAASDIIIPDLPFTAAEFEQAVARLHRYGQNGLVRVVVPLTCWPKETPGIASWQTFDQCLWDLINAKRALSDLAIDGNYNATNSISKVKKALSRWIEQMTACEFEIEEQEDRRIVNRRTECKKTANQTTLSCVPSF